LVGHDIYAVPLIFHLVVGYFQHNPEKLKSEGLFRVAAGDHDVADLEVHLSFQNYHRMLQIDNPNIVSNYLKKMMREMSEPICPYSHYGNFMKLANVPSEQRVEPLRALIKRLPRQSYNTIKYIIKFLITVEAQKEHNWMNHYNLAVTVGPNIFRSKEISP
jgi:hypothetical protein